MKRLLALIFVLSGAAGLIYESIWSRYLGLFVGHSAYAQVIVLVIFLGGMSAGAALAARRSARLREPLLAYAVIEGVVGIVGLLFHDAYGVVTRIAYDSIFPALSSGALLVTAKWSIAALMILPQSVLLGATFPLMSAGVLRRLGDPNAQLRESGRTIGLLYFANSIGAAAGVLLAGFWLLEMAGLPGTLLAAVIINMVVALATFAIVRFERDDRANDVEDGATPAPEPQPIDGAEVATTEPGTTHALWRLLIAVSFGTALASFIYEIAWIRMLSMVLGSATHAFELMLSAFILGLALGALYIRMRADRTADTVRLLGIVQFIMGTAAILTLAVYVDSFQWMAWLMDALDTNDSGYKAFNLARYGIALMVMLPATFCAGMTLPLITRSLLAAGHGEKAIGDVYAWNTLGSIVGAAAASLVLLPAIGLRATLILGGALDIALGIWLLWTRVGVTAGVARTARLATAAGVLVVMAALIAPGFDPGMLASGVFRYGRVPARGARHIVFYEDGRTATVTVQKGPDSSFTIATNGKPDGSVYAPWFRAAPDSALRTALRGDEATQVLLALVTLAHAPQARTGAVIGHGTGMSSHFLLGSPHLDHLATIDIEPQMVEGSKLFRPVNERVFSDPRSVAVFDDAKSYFAASGRQYDLILSEPSNPWVSGVSGLFTDEFYQRITKALAPNGVFGQWLHLYEIEDPLVLSVLRALAANFRSFDIFYTHSLDVLVVATNAPTLPRPDWSVFRYPEVARDLERFRTLSPATLEAMRLATRSELLPLVADRAGANSDFFPFLDLHAERSRFMRRQAEGLARLEVERFDVAAALGERRIGWVGEADPSLPMERIVAQAVAARVRNPALTLPSDTSIVARTVRLAWLREARVNLEIQSGRPPADWEAWFDEVVQVERDRHQGTMGVVDSTWYRAVERYMAAQRAPAEAQAALRFMRGVMSYHWREAGREVQVLADARDAGRTWIPVQTWCDAATIALLRAGDVVGARTLFDRFNPGTGRARSDFRVQLVEAYLQQAERALRAPSDTTR